MEKLHGIAVIYHPPSPVFKSTHTDISLLEWRRNPHLQCRQWQIICPCSFIYSVNVDVSDPEGLI